MKTFTILFLALVFLGITSQSQEVVVAGWTFPGESALADTGVVGNLDKNITTAGGTSPIQFKNGYSTKAAQVTHWENGEFTKAWVLEFTTEGYNNLTISSRQQSGGNEPGPKEFKLQYSIDVGFNWVDVDNGSIIVENDWETGLIDNLSLPVECQNQASMMLRWIMVSNEASGNGGPVLESGKSKIDDIYIRGELANDIVESQSLKLSIGPNPASEYIMVSSNLNSFHLSIMNLSGKIVQQNFCTEGIRQMDISDLQTGIYFVSVKKGNRLASSTLIIY